MKLFKMKEVVDERERMEMYKIEHYMFWYMFWALLAAIFGQLIFMGAGALQVAGEWIVFMSASVATVILEIKGGHFDYYSRPGWKSYLVYSLATGLAFAFLSLSVRYSGGYLGSLQNEILMFFCTGVFVFLFTYAALAAVGEWTKRRRKKLEEDYEED